MRSLSNPFAVSFAQVRSRISFCSEIEAGEPSTSSSVLNLLSRRSNSKLIQELIGERVFSPSIYIHAKEGEVCRSLSLSFSSLTLQRAVGQRPLRRQNYGFPNPSCAAGAEPIRQRPMKSAWMCWTLRSISTRGGLIIGWVSGMDLGRQAVHWESQALLS